MLRAAFLTAIVALAGCEPAVHELRLVTLESPESVGLALRELPPDSLRAVGLPYGLAVVKAGGIAERAGLRLGDVVFGVNHRRIGSLEDFNRLVAQAPGRLALLVRRGKKDFYVALELSLPAPARDTLLRT